MGSRPTERERIALQTYRMGHTTFAQLTREVRACHIPSELVPEVVVSTYEGRVYHEYWALYSRSHDPAYYVLIRQFC